MLVSFAFVRPSIRRFSWNWVISFFSDTHYDVHVPVWAPCVAVFDSRILFLKNSIWTKMTKMVKNSPKVGFFNHFEIFCH